MKEERQIEIDAVDKERLIDLVDILGLKKNFEEMQYHCEVCRDAMTYDNTKFIFPKPNRTVGFVCKKASCVVEFTLSGDLDKRENHKTGE